MRTGLLNPIAEPAAPCAVGVTAPRVARPPLGRQRTLLVLSSDPELAVALRDRLDRAMLTVYEVREREAADVIVACRPWPWMLVGDVTAVASPVGAALTSHPILLRWRGPAPPGLPGHLTTHGSFSELATAVEQALHSTVAGVRLAVGSGLTMPDGAHVSSPALEALVAGHPRPLPLTPGQLRTATLVLATHGVAARPRPGRGGVVLAPGDGG